MAARPLTADPVHAGHYISGAGHLTLIGWMLFGGVFRSEPPPLEMTEVAVISGADFEAMMAARQPPSSATEVAQPAAPEETPQVPQVAAPQEPAPTQPAPTPTPAPTEENPPDVTELAAPPQAEVADTPPELDQPVGDTVVQVPELAPQAVPRPVERVAPEPVAQPDPDTTPDQTEQAAVAPDAAGETPQDPQEATAPEEATTEIVTEATAAPKSSQRPPGRRPAAPAAPAAAQPSVAEAINDSAAAAIAAAVAEAQTNAAPSGPPLSASEREGMRVAVSNCWNVDVGSRAADTVVTVLVRMERNGKVRGAVELLSAQGGDDAAVRTAFGAARRAILRCQKDGYPLPAEKYDHWKEIEMTFNPKTMRVK